jgi:2-keto-4-pentenoate hydratase/2-oxohepta-3-ene-1,7-dioic acid hydratase in catechol pathway
MRLVRYQADGLTGLGALLADGSVVTTPGGVGFFRDPPEFMQPGDTIVAEVSRVGRLTNRVVRGW